MSGDTKTATDATARPDKPVTAAPPDLDSLTPAMRQYWTQKQQAGEAILLFRMGDFYELFYDDAALAARVLGLTLTSRDNGKTPLAGIPYHALDGYLARLVNAGYKVAISEQIETPTTLGSAGVPPAAERVSPAAKKVVDRAIVRIVTPGTLTDDGLLDQTRPNILAAVCPADAQVGVATVELSTGEIAVWLCDEDALLDELVRVGPAEVLLAEWSGVGRHPLDGPVRDRTGAYVTHRNTTDFNPHRAQALIEEQFEVRGLIGFGFEKIDPSLQAAGALLAYVRETQIGAIKHLRPPRRQRVEDYLILDQTTLRSLEVERTMRSGARSGSLLAAVDLTCNAMGARLLRQWLCYPLCDVERIRQRQRLIAALRDESRVREDIRAALRDIGDIERMVGRLGVQRTTPRELRALADSLRRLPPLRDALHALRTEAADALAERLEGLDEPAALLHDALAADPPIAVREGGIFRDGHHAELDRLRTISRDGASWLSEYQAREIERAGIPSLKVGFNRVFGYYIEITNAHRDRVPDDYVRKQTLKNAERYITDELKRYEAEVLSAESRANELEYELFIALRDQLLAYIPRLQQAAGALAVVDVLAGWAELSLRRPFCRPEFVDEPLLDIDDGRHPVLESTMEKSFVPNDTKLTAREAKQETKAESSELDGDAPEPSNPPTLEASAPQPLSPLNPPTLQPSPGSLSLITGPNMAGKSTYIRQVALLTLLAQCGCWVPARRMRLGLVDRIFTRVGASDELARGQSTFMVEMLETANILHNATPRSLVILDEIGRGTSTFDGLSLAWAITEHLARRVRCRALFATHYHELTELGSPDNGLDGVANLNVAVREYEDQVVFLHRIIPGAADRSYGLHVAKLAGVPREVLERANTVLNELEKSFDRESQRPVLAAVQRRRKRQLRLFEEPEEAIVRELRELDVAALTPEQAAERVKKWRGMLEC